MGWGDTRSREVGRACGRPAWPVAAYVACLLAAAFPGGAALAQAAPAIRPPTREAIEPVRPLPPARSRLSIEGGIERSPCALADPAYAAIRLTLTEVVFNNLGPVAPGDLAASYRRYLGQDVPISAVCEIRDAAATTLRAKGYLAAVQVPTQRIEGGKVRLEVLYARMTAVRVKGEVGPDERLIERTLARLSGGAVFNTFTAERALLLARDLPGLDVRLALKPAGTGPGEMIGEVSVRRTPLEIEAGIQNYAPHESGPFGGQLRAQINGITGLGDRTSLSIYSTADFDEQQVIQLLHDMALGSDGLRLGGSFTYAWTRPGLGAGVPSVFARTLFANLEASYPFIRSQRLTLRGAAGFDFVNQDVRFAGAPLSRDRLRVAYLRLDGDAVDMRGRGPGGTVLWHLAGSLELRQGLDILDASPDCAANIGRCSGAGFVPPGLAGSNPAATVARFSGLAEVRLTPTFSIALMPRAQIASSSVFAFEQMSAGNYTIGRGYDPGTLTGDDGVGIAAEVRLDKLVVWPRQDVAIQPFAFIDSAWLWTRGNAPGVDPRRLTSVGAGAHVSWADHARLDMTLAVPVESVGSAQSGDVRFLVSLTTRLVPWRTR